MNEQRLLNAIGGIDDQFILSAQRRMGLSGASKSKVLRSRRILRRTIVALAAAFIMLLGSFSVAFAVNDEFREAVIRFFGIEQPEAVPEYKTDAVFSAEEMVVEEQKANIGGVIEGTYIHTPIASSAEAGVFLICTDEVQMKQGSRYDAYREENGELIKLEAHPFRETLTVNGYEFQTDFEWVELDGRTIVTYCEPSAPYRIPDFAGPPESTLITFLRFDRETWVETAYPALVDLKTGAVTEVLAGMDVPELSSTAISDDRSKMLLAAADGTLYYADLVSKKLYSIDELSGEHASNCSLLDGALACWALNGADAESAALGNYRAWAIDLATMERREIFGSIPATAATSYDVWSETYAVAQQSPEVWEQIGRGALPPLNRAGIQFIAGFGNIFYSGNVFSGSPFAVEVQEDRSVYVIDLLSGEKTPVEGFLWPDADYPEVQWVPSPDGAKLLIYGANNEVSGNVFEYIGVLDFERKLYIQFSRENTNDVNESSAYWFDNDRIVVRTNASDVSMDYYVYELLY